jgi:hypothetical protein
LEPRRYAHFAHFEQFSFRQLLGPENFSRERLPAPQDPIEVLQTVAMSMCSSGRAERGGQGRLRENRQSHQL